MTESKYYERILKQCVYALNNSRKHGNTAQTSEYEENIIFLKKKLAE